LWRFFFAYSLGETQPGTVSTAMHELKSSLS
jgi:hypothetical protein